MITSRDPNRRDVLKMAWMAGGAIVLAPLLKACGSLPAATSTPTAGPVATDRSPVSGLQGLDVDAFFEGAYRLWMKRDPENLTTLGLADAYGAGNANLTDISDAFIRETQSIEKGTLELLRGYDRATMTAAQSLTAEVFDWFLDDLVRGHPFIYDDYPVNPILTSIPYNLYMLFTVYQPLNNAEDAKDYIARLSQVGRKFGQLIDGLRRREEHGVVLPGFLLRYVQADIAALGSGSAASHAYLAALEKRLTGVSEDERNAFVSEAAGVVEESVMPAYRELSEFLVSQQSRAGNQVGVWQFADGEAYYSQCLRRHTTTSMTADEIHELGRQNVERIHSEMRPLFASLGFSPGESILELFNRLTAEGGVYSGQAAVSAYEQSIRIAEELLPQAFNARPHAEVRVIGGRDGDYYMPASYDGSRPGLFFARTDGSTPRFGVKTTGFHETVPGHHFQIALAQEVPGLPDLRRGMQFNAYTEGWALYAERLMSELGAYADDPAGELGRLRMEAYRAARLVIDTGIHAKRWSFDEAVSYLMEAAGFPSGYARGEVTRYCVWPGQATSYYIGFLKLLELRESARQALGAKFDLRAFHDVVLANGSVPLTTLERLVQNYTNGAA